MVGSIVVDPLIGTLVWLVGWPYETPSTSSSDFIVTLRKTVSGNSYKILSMIQ
jgi:hypothetical protein